MPYDPYQGLRLGNLFGVPSRPPGFRMGKPTDIREQGQLSLGQPRPFSPDYEEEPEEDDSGSNYIKEIMRLSNPGPQMTAYQGMLQNMPQRQDYAPGKMNRFAAALSGFGAGLRNPAEGYATASSIVEQPYSDAMKDYSNRVGLMRESAGIERQASEDRLRAVTGAMNYGLNYRKYLKSINDAASLDRYRQGELEQRGLANQNATERNRLTGVGHELTRQRDQNTADYRRGQLSNQEKNINSLIGYRKITGEAAASQAQSAATRAQTGKDTLKWRKEQGSKPISPSQDAYLIQQIYQGMRMDPNWRKFIENPDPSDPNYFQPIAPDGSRTYELFKQELKKRHDDALKNRDSLTGLTGDPYEDDNFEIIDDKEDDDAWPNY